MEVVRAEVRQLLAAKESTSTGCSDTAAVSATTPPPKHKQADAIMQHLDAYSVVPTDVVMVLPASLGKRYPCVSMVAAAMLQEGPLQEPQSRSYY